MKRLIVIVAVSLNTLACTSVSNQQAVSFTKHEDNRRFEILKRVPPRYPENARKNFIEGYIGIRYTVFPDGTVNDIAVIKEHPKGVFFDAAVKAIRKSEYRPKMVNGELKPTVRRQLFRFELSKDMIKQTCEELDAWTDNPRCDDI